MEIKLDNEAIKKWNLTLDLPREYLPLLPMIG